MIDVLTALVSVGLEPGAARPTTPSSAGDSQTVLISISIALVCLALALIVYAPLLIIREMSSWRKTQQKKAFRAEPKRAGPDAHGSRADEQRRAQDQAFREAASREAARRQREAAGRQQQAPPNAGTTRPPAQTKNELDEYYRILGLEPGASESTIRAAHRRLIVTFHTDHLPDSVNHQVRELVNEQMKKINVARDKLLAVARRG